ncbi:MAG: hypothetical protein KGL78_14395 [Burkholderiales bacterium]|nr:hypothetical protein [Burkholderiales bacterium]
MLNVFLTTDVELWCDGWRDIDAKFPDAFRRYIYGPTPTGEVGLRYQAALLREHGLTGVFFVEALFSGRFGLEPLSEIVGLVREQGHEVQLHLHTEWVDEWLVPPMAEVERKRQFMRNWTFEQQQILISEGRARLEKVGSGTVNCHRAGSFGFNADTLRALARCGIAFDASYDACHGARESGVAPGRWLTDVCSESGVVEFPMTVYRTGTGRLRHAQIGACSSSEIEGLLWSALEAGQRSFVVLTHNFELLNAAKDRADDVAVARFRRLCAFLSRHRDCFRVRGFNDPALPAPGPQPEPLRSPLWKTAWRNCEQVYRRRYA